MKRVDEAIDKVLAGLRASEAPVGLEERVLHAVQARVATGAAQHSPGRQAMRWLTPGRWLAFGLAMAGLAGVAVLAPRLHQVDRHDAGTAVAEQTSFPRLPAPSGPDSIPDGKREMPGRAGAAPKVVAYRPMQKPGNETDGDRLGALAREEMLAPSLPTPPLPMTTQEKLFRQAVVAEHFDQLAMLNPEERAKADAKADDEFAGFFGAKEPVKQEEPAAGGAAEDKPVEQKQDEPVPIAASGASQSNSGRRK